MTELEANYKSCQLSKLFPREVKQNAASPATLNTTAEKVKVEEILNERLFLFLAALAALYPPWSLTY